MRNVLFLWPQGKSLASQLIAILLWILKVWSGVGFFSGQSGEASCRRVCYQRGLPRLVSEASVISWGKNCSQTLSIHILNFSNP